jgi:hypothetical protein
VLNSQAPNPPSRNCLEPEGLRKKRKSLPLLALDKPRCLIRVDHFNQANLNQQATKACAIACQGHPGFSVASQKSTLHRSKQTISCNNLIVQKFLGDSIDFCTFFKIIESPSL